jgi:hypothetical protein
VRAYRPGCQSSQLISLGSANPSPSSGESTANLILGSMCESQSATRPARRRQFAFTGSETALTPYAVEWRFLTFKPFCPAHARQKGRVRPGRRPDDLLTEKRLMLNAIATQ